MSRIRQRLSDLAWRMSSDQPEWPELPDPVQANWDEPSVAAYWRARLTQHTDDSYVGIPMSKFPEDLRVYEHLLWLSRSNVVIEVGSYYGGSALWLRDRLQAFARYGRIPSARVVSVDLDVTPARRRSRPSTELRGDDRPRRWRHPRSSYDGTDRRGAAHRLALSRDRRFGSHVRVDAGCAHTARTLRPAPRVLRRGGRLRGRPPVAHRPRMAPGGSSGSAGMAGLRQRARVHPSTRSRAIRRLVPPERFPPAVWRRQLTSVPASKRPERR